jgi:hypothetical protein
MRGPWPEAARRIVSKVQRLEYDPAGDGKRLTNYSPEYRLRVGDWRVLFDVEGGMGEGIGDEQGSGGGSGDERAIMIERLTARKRVQAWPDSWHPEMGGRERRGILGILRTGDFARRSGV